MSRVRSPSPAPSNYPSLEWGAWSMVESRSRTYQNGLTGTALAEVERALRRVGVPEDQIKVVYATLTMPTGQAPPDSDGTQGELIPPNLMTLKEASKHFDLSIGRLRHWIYRGHLPISEQRRKASAPGGGELLFDPIDVQTLIDNPPRPGRPSTNRN